WREIWAYQRLAILTSAATALLAFGVGGPVIWSFAKQSGRNEVLVRSLGTDNPRITPVVLQTDDGKTMVTFVGHPTENGSTTGEENGEAVVPNLNPAPQGGEL